MEAISYQVLIIFSIFIFSNGEESFNLSDIVTESKSVIKAQLTKENDDFLRKYYFTKDKSTAVWNFAIAPRQVISKKELKLCSAKQLSSEMLKIEKDYNECFNTDIMKKRVACWFDLAYTMINVNKKMHWNSSLSEKVNYGVYYNLYALMAYHIAVIASNDHKAEHGEDLGKSVAEITNKNKTKEGDHKIENYFVPLLKELNELLDELDVGARKWRLRQVTPVIVCDLIEVFWQEIEINCEPAKIKIAIIKKQLVEKEENDKKKSDKEEIMGKFGTRLEAESLKFRSKVWDKIEKKYLLKEEITVKRNEDEVKKAFSSYMDDVRSMKVQKQRKLKNDLDNYSETYFESIKYLGNHVFNLIS